jgi:sugar phosphate isomerase/epimerase
VALVAYDSRMKNSFSRRDFVRSGAMLAAAASAPAAAFAAAPLAAAPIPEPGPIPAAPFKLGIASYTFRNFTRDKVIENLKTLKVSTINCKDIKDHLPFAAAEEAIAVEAYKAAGIKIVGAGTVTFNKDDDGDIRSKFEYLKRAGITTVVAGGPTPAILVRIEKFVKEYDIKFALHNHGPEDPTWHSPLDVLKVVKNMDPRMGCCIDIGHCARAGVNPVDAIKQVGARVFDLHAKDLANYQSRDSQVDVGDGILPIHGIFEALIAIKYKAYVDLEYEINADNPMPGVIKSFAYMRGVLAGMGYKA